MKLNDFFANIYSKRTHVRPNTWTAYESYWRNHICPAFGEFEIEDITAPAIEEWIDSAPSAGAARKAYAVLRTMLRKAYKWGYAPTDPTVLGVELPAQRRYIPDTLTAKELKELIRGFWGSELEAVVLSSATLGLRRCESCGLQWGDIDLRSGDVMIQRGRQYVGKQVIVTEPKTELSRRRLVYPKFALERMRDIGRGKPKGEYLCDLSPDAIGRKYKAHCKKNGLPYVSLKNLRHSYATTMIEAGVPLEIVSLLLGHSEIRTTYEYYVRPRRSMLVDAQKTYEAYLMAA